MKNYQSVLPAVNKTLRVFDGDKWSEQAIAIPPDAPRPKPRKPFSFASILPTCVARLDDGRVCGLPARMFSIRAGGYVCLDCKRREQL